MSAPPISASDRAAARKRADAEMRAALAAGWRRSDLWWERLQERANRDWEAGDRARALRGFRLGYWLALGAFRADDPRRATSLANAGFAARARGSERTATRRYAAALRLWAGLGRWLDGIEVKPRARSSLFHLRMELRHREAFRANMRTRLARFVAEADAALAALANGRPPPAPLFPRWKGAKPPVFDDTRKVIAACLLIAPSKSS
jgi:hypothetical protein